MPCLDRPLAGCRLFKEPVVRYSITRKNKFEDTNSELGKLPERKERYGSQALPIGEDLKAGSFSPGRQEKLVINR